jgi:hypothetical protein
MLVDEVVSHDLLRPCQWRVVRVDEDLADRGVAAEARQHHGFAVVASAGVAELVDGQRRFVVAAPQGQACDVAIGAVGVVGHDEDLQRLALADEDGLRWEHLDADERAGGFAVVLGSVGDPVVQRAERFRVRLDPLTALVSDLGSRLAQQQAAFGRRQVDATAEQVPGQGAMVDLRVVAEQGQAESVLAGGGAVAAASIAAALGQHRDDLVAVARGGLVRAGHLHGQGRPQVAVCHGQHGFARAASAQDGTVAFEQWALGPDRGGVRRAVDHRAAGRVFEDDDALVVACGVE